MWGTLNGRLLLPGVIFIGIALWWSLITSIKYVQLLAYNIRRRCGESGLLITSHTYHTSVGMPCICLPSRRLRRGPVEPWVRIAIILFGIIEELVHGLHLNTAITTNVGDASLYGCDSNGNHVGANSNDMKNIYFFSTWNT